MADIRHLLSVRAASARVWEAMATPAGLDSWWTLECAGEPRVGERYALNFGPGYVWTGEVVRAEPERALEWIIRDAQADWEGTRVGFELEQAGELTTVRFHHTGWSEENDHYIGSSTCWAMYLRLMKRFVEHGERVPYGERLEA